MDLLRTYPPGADLDGLDLHRRWPLPGATDLRDHLASAYADSSRGYHDTRHLAEVLDRLDELAAAGVGFDALPVVLAAWFHDAVYDGERDAEERSAVLAEDTLDGVIDADLVAEVARLVRMTETHDPAPDDLDGCALSDADLAILAAPPERYDEYAAAVRREFAALSDETFTAGRRAVLEGLAAKPTLFYTAYAQERWEAPARENLARELGAGRG